MRVHFLTQYYPPEMGAPQARISEFARGLSKKGWDVHVLTALPNYPAGKVFPEYQGRKFVREERDGVSVQRTWIRPDGSGRVSARLFAAASFAASACAAAAVAKRRGGVVVAESPPLTLGPGGIIISRLLRASLVMNISDLWPSSLVEMGVLRGKRLIRLAEGVEAHSYGASKLITAQAPDIVSNIQQRFPAANVKLLSNGVDTGRFHPGLRSEAVRRDLGLGEGLLVTYAGLHGLAQGLDSAVDAASRVQDLKDVHFLFIGDGPAKPALVRKTEELGLRNVRFLPPVAREQVAPMLASSDIALITLSHAIHGAIPSKIYEAMASGLPIVAATGGGAEAIINRAGAGICVPPGAGDQIAEAVRALAGDADRRRACAEAGRRTVCEEYDRQLWIDRLAEYLAEVHPARDR